MKDNCGDTYWMTAQEIASMYHLSIRTTNNRLSVLRKEKPDCFKEVLTKTKHKQYLYLATAITKENVGTRHYVKHEKVIPEVELPPIYLVNPEKGMQYNLFSLKALLMVLENTTLFERFVALDSIIFVCIIVYLFTR